MPGRRGLVRPSCGRSRFPRRRTSRARPSPRLVRHTCERNVSGAARAPDLVELVRPASNRSGRGRQRARLLRVACHLRIGNDGLAAGEASRAPFAPAVHHESRHVDRQLRAPWHRRLVAAHERRIDRARHYARRGLASLGEDLRDARLDAGLSQRAVGAVVGLSHTEVSRVERGLVPAVPYETLVLIGAALGLDIPLRAYPEAIQFGTRRSSPCSLDFDRRSRRRSATGPRFHSGSPATDGPGTRSSRVPTGSCRSRPRRGFGTPRRSGGASR